MIISERARLLLYILMAIFPIWLDFFKLSTDYSFRGLAMPILASLNAAVVVALAKTSSRRDLPLSDSGALETVVTNTTEQPLPTKDVPPSKKAK